MFARSPRSVRPARNRRQVLASAIEMLEPRQLLTTITVNSVDDNTTSDNLLTLREAMLLVEHGGDSNAALSRVLTSAEQAQIDLGVDPFGTNDFIGFDSSIAESAIDFASAIEVKTRVTIDGGLGMTLTGGSSQASHRAFEIDSTGDLKLVSLTVKNFSHRGATTTVNPTDGLGGAIYVDGGSLELLRVTVSSNSAIGGNYYDINHHGSGNSGAGRGGAIYSDGGSIVITDSTFSSNAATGGSNSYSYLSGGASGSAYGGAIYLVGSNTLLSITDSSFASNNATAGYYDPIMGGGSAGTGNGGAVYTSGATITVDVVGSTFSSNTASSNSHYYGGSSYGGAFYVDASTLNIVQSTLASNSTGSNYIWMNSGGQGGAIYAKDAIVDINFATVSSNSAPSGGQGLYVQSTGVASATISNSIFGQAANTYDDITFNGTVTTTGSKNLVRKTTVTGLDIVSTADPKLASLGDYGGKTKTMTLLAYSPALNAAGGTNLNLDQRGNDRVKFDVADLGAIESNGAAPSISSSNSTVLQPNANGSFTITTTGTGTITLTQTGTLPAGVTFHDNGDGTATLGGTPTEGGVFNLTVEAVNGFPGAQSQQFTLTVQGSPTVSSSNHTNFQMENAGTFTVTSSAHPVATLSVIGTLPNGVTFVDNNDGTGTLAGTPTGVAPGEHSFEIKASNTEGDGFQTFTLTIEAAPTFSSSDVADFNFGAAGTFTITTVGYPLADIQLTGQLPAGLSFVDNHDGTATISGTPTTGGDFSVSIAAGNYLNSSPTMQTLTVSVSGAPTINSVASAEFLIDTADSYTVTTTGFPTPTLAVIGTLPTGLTFTDNNDGTGTISGTATGVEPGLHTFDIIASNGEGEDAVQNFTLAIKAAATITSATTASFQVGVARTFTVTTGGYPHAQLSLINILPEGLTFHDNSDGTATISGTPTEAAEGDHSVSLSATNGIGSTATQTLAVTVRPALTRMTAVASGASQVLKVYNTDGTERLSIDAPMGNTKTQLRIGYGDLTNDGADDIVVGGNKSKIAVFDGATGDKAAEFHAFKPSFQPGLYVATGDVNGDGIVDILVGQGQGSRSSVKIFSGADQSEIAYFRVFDGKYGVRVAAADLNGDGFAEVIGTQDEAGGRTTVRIYDGQALSQGTVTKIADYRPFGDTYRGGAYVATGDVNADGTPDVVLGQAAGRSPQVSVFSGSDNALIANLQMQATRGGVRVSTIDFDNDGHADIVAGAIVGQTFVVKTISGANQTLLDEQVTEFKGSVFIA